MLEFDPVPLNQLAPLLRDALAIEEPTVLVNHASRCEVALVAREQHSLHTSSPGLVQHESQQVRGIAFVALGRPYAVTNVPAIIAKSVGQRMTQSALAEDTGAAHQEEDARRNAVGRTALATFPLPDTAGETKEVASHLCERHLTPGFPGRSVLLQVRDALLAARLVRLYLYELQILGIHVSLVARIENSTILPRRTVPG